MCVTYYEEFGKIRSFEFVKNCFTDCQSIQNNALAGYFVQTACVNLKQILHNVINISDFEWRLQCWEMLLRYLFACSKVHYARYENFYINFLAYVKATHPKTETKAKLRQVAMTV